jgi:hypothetical protein
MIIAAGEWDNTSSSITHFARVAYNIFFTIEEKNNDKQQFSPVRHLKNAMNTHFFHDRRQTVDRCVQ